MRKNKLRELLQSGSPTLGTRLQSTWPSVVEVVGHTGLFDYVEFLAEYAPYTLSELDNFCRAAELHNLGTMIKIDSEPRQYLAQRAIGAGFESVLFADSRSAEDARQCVRTARPETPTDAGLYGAATRRFAYMGYGGNEEYVQALRDVVVVLMIEKQPAVERLDEILAVGGIDMIQWGPADYSMSIGKPGQRQSPEVKAAERKVIETCLRAGIPPRAEINSPDDAHYYLDLGVRHFSLSSDLSILYNWLKGNGEKLRGLLT
ncbi:MAG: 2,4-dihydroxyhept-2-ene-1,7-dioic acid aldolase [Chloroflexi bacterium]|nr:MAG: 2,4-dihydroxyhept-2-ene-1,7-dioic acid aldolase [Chloroflexota bacterium]